MCGYNPVRMYLLIILYETTHTYGNPSAIKKGIWWNAKPYSFVYYPVLPPENHYTLKCFFHVFAKKIFFTQKPRGVYTICPLVNNTFCVLCFWVLEICWERFQVFLSHTQNGNHVGRYVNWIDYNYFTTYVSNHHVAYLKYIQFLFKKIRGWRLGGSVG